MTELLFWNNLYIFLVLVVLTIAILIIMCYFGNFEEEEIEECDVTESDNMHLTFYHLEEMKENPCYSKS